jgi:spermidine synthase
MFTGFGSCWPDYYRSHVSRGRVGGRLEGPCNPLIRSALIAILVAVFILSGAAGLIYESLWSRYLGLFVGHSAYAQIIVLVMFLGGMSLGAWLVGRRSTRFRSPLLWYAGVEVLVGLIALVFHDTFGAATEWAYGALFPALGGAGLTVGKWAVASVLILPQSILLGTTFPLMSAGVIRLARAGDSPGSILGLLYFANSLGAAAGVLLAGFVFIERAGLPGTLMIAGFMNVVAGLGVYLLARSEQRREYQLRHAPVATDLPGTAAADATELPPPAPAIPGTERRGDDWYPLLLVSFGTAVASFIYEIAWIRMLSLVLGSATHSFELMLSAFILGLALGALWIRSRADRLTNPIRFLGIVQWVMGLLAVATLPLYVASFSWMSVVIETVQQNESGYRLFQFARYFFALLIMLPATFCAGMTLPLITRVLMRGGAGERAIGAVYAVNTLGSILGVVLAGLLLMPVLGLKNLLIAGALVDAVLGVWLVVRSRDAATRGRRWAQDTSIVIPVLATVAAILIIAVATRFDLIRLTSGVYRHGIVERATGYDFPFYKDGRTATVSVRRTLDGFVTLATNGKPDASMEREWMDTSAVSGGRRELRRDIATQLLLPIITLAHVPEARDVAIIGHGSGMSSHVLLGSPSVREAVTIEIEPEMIAASRVFRPANVRVFEDPRSTFVIDDAKSYFASSRRSFDLILSEPSNPWVSGVSGLFTVEFYQRVQRQLAPNGVFGQWLHLYELSDGLVTSVIAAIDSVFPAYEVFFTSNADILVVAATGILPAPRWDVIRFPGIAQDLRKVVPMGAETFEALRLGGREVLHPLVLSQGAPNSDYFPTLDLGAERMRFMHESAQGYIDLAAGRFDVVAALTGRRLGFGSIAITATPEVDRPLALALGSRIRAMRTLPPEITRLLPHDGDLRSALYRIDALERMTGSSKPPADWHEFMGAVVDADRDIHSGTAGVVDSAFFSQVRSYAARAGAPLEARAGIDFLQGIGAWNWPQASVSARALLASTDTVTWIPDVLLRNGAAVASIMLRDTAQAKEVLRTFAKRTLDDRFREHLIAAYLTYSDTTLRRRRGWR